MMKYDLKVNTGNNSDTRTEIDSCKRLAHTTETTEFVHAVFFDFSETVSGRIRLNIDKKVNCRSYSHISSPI